MALPSKTTPFREARAKLTRGRPSLDILTDRERDVLAGLVLGLTNKRIGGLLGISHRTIEVHRARVMHKLGVRNLSALLEIAFAQRDKLPEIASSMDETQS